MFIGKDGDEESPEMQAKWSKAFRNMGFGDARLQLVEETLEKAAAEVTASAKRLQELQKKLDAAPQADGQHSQDEDYLRELLLAGGAPLPEGGDCMRLNALVCPGSQARRRSC
jgi:hypothetical protein